MMNKEMKRQNVITEMKRKLVKKYLDRGFCIDDAYLKTSSKLNEIFNKDKRNHEKNFNEI